MTEAVQDERAPLHLFRVEASFFDDRGGYRTTQVRYVVGESPEHACERLRKEIKDTRASLNTKVWKVIHLTSFISLLEQP